MTSHDLARQAADLLSTEQKSPARSLSQLVALAAREVPGCSGAAAALWGDDEADNDEPAETAASHPQAAELLESEIRGGRGPMLTALATGQPAHCPDTLEDRIWPEYAHAALCRGVRCSVTLVYQRGTGAVTLSLLAARPGALDPDQLPLAELLVAAGGAVMGNVSQYADARRTALQFRDAEQSRPLVDQAKGILMQALGCSADEALARMRQISQRGNVRVTEVARTVIESRRTGAG